MAVLAIDQGTSGTKAVVVSDDGDVLAIVENTVRPTYLAAGGVEQDPMDLLHSVLDAGRKAVTQAGVPVSAVSLANQGETVLVWDPETGRPLSPAVVWQDRRSETLCRGKAAARSWVEQRTGLILDPYFSAPKMQWLRRNVSREGVVTTADTWIVHHLTGEFVTDTATASRSLLTGLDTGGWDRELLELFELAEERLPEIVGNDALVGKTDAFGGSAAVGGLIVDQQAALLAERCLDPGTAKCTFGTGVFLLANTGRYPVRSASQLASCVAWNVRGQTSYCVDGQAYTAASAIRWIQDLGLIASARDLDSTAAEDSGGTYFVPALAGLAAPWWRPDATASFTGMTLSTDRTQLVAAVVEGLAAQTAELVSAVEVDLGGPLARLRVDGGLTQSRRLMQATADLTQIPIDVYPSSHATALGAAACARLAMNPGLSLADAVADWTPATTYEPRWSPDRAAEFRHHWTSAAHATLPQEKR